MKKVFLIIAITLLSLNSFAQKKINANDLIGYWEPNEQSTLLFFWKDVNGKLQVQEISGTSGKPLDVIEFKIANNYIIIKEIFLQNNWVTENIYTLIDKKTLKCSVKGDSQGVLIYTKIK